ncbi:MAG: hypothetical protein IT379_07925 [Deltaproteobacteria bacterium]|nr:hypothetical protein [Deltaproteobacteria bacterium]
MRPSLRTTVLLSAVVVVLASCAYPQRRAPVLPMSGDMAASTTPPANLYSVVVVSAEVPGTRRDGQSWDPDGGPDPYVRILRDGEVVFESRVMRDTRRPEFRHASTFNIRFAPRHPIEVQLLDRDELSDDAIGTWRGPQLPDGTVIGTHWRVLLEGRAIVEIELARPIPERGSGLLDYEIHDGSIVVRSLVADSPLGRAGGREGDEIVQVGDRSLEDLGEGELASAAARMGAGETTIVVLRDDQRQELRLDGGPVWRER